MRNWPRSTDATGPFLRLTSGRVHQFSYKYTIMKINVENHCHIDPFAKPRKFAKQARQMIDKQQAAAQQMTIESAIQQALRPHFVEWPCAPATSVSYNLPPPSVDREAIEQTTEPHYRPTVIYRQRKHKQPVAEVPQTKQWLFMGMRLVLRMRQFWRSQARALDKRFGSNPSKRRDGNARRARH